MRRVAAAGGEPRLAASRCTACGHVTFPARARCPACRGGTLAEAALGPEATVESSTTLHVSTVEFEAPYALALVRFDEGPTVLARVDAPAPAGARVRLAVDVETDTFWFTTPARAAPTTRPRRTSSGLSYGHSAR